MDEAGISGTDKFGYASKFGLSLSQTRFKTIDSVTPPSPSSSSFVPPSDSAHTTPPSPASKSFPHPLSLPTLSSNGSSLPLANQSSPYPPTLVKQSPPFPPFQQNSSTPFSKSKPATPPSPAPVKGPASSSAPLPSPPSSGLLSHSLQHLPSPPPPNPPPPLVNHNSPPPPSNSYASLSPPPPLSPLSFPPPATLSPPNVTPPPPPSDFPTSPPPVYSPVQVPSQHASPATPTVPASSSTTNSFNPFKPTNSTKTMPSKPLPSSISNGQQLVSDQPSVNPPKESSSSSVKPTPTKVSSDTGLYVGTQFIIGFSVSAAVIILLLAVIFVAIRKKKGKTHAIDCQYRPPGNLYVKSDGFYHAHGNTGHLSVLRDPHFRSPLPSPGAPGYSKESYHGHDPTGSKTWFTFEELMEITNGFSPENLLGEGGFGCVYKGWLLDGRCVAVKQLKAGSGQGEREFRAEVEIISRVHHRHLVSLVGYCIAEYHRLLVYEFVPNNTLEYHLHGKGLAVMDWSKRVRIAIGSARGLAYLHEDCHPRIIHRDIKSANILLDETFEAQVADFGLARLSNDAATHVSTRVVGTFGYMAPEYVSSGKLTDRSDVYSFGVVLLELITGRKPVDPSQPLGDESLVDWAKPQLIDALETGNCEPLVDPRLEGNFSKSEMLNMIEVATACVRHSAPKRPRMLQVVRALDNDGQMLDLTNGVKFGQSTVYDSGQYSADIQRFRLMAFGSCKCSSRNGSSKDYENWNSDQSYDSRDSSKPLNPESPRQPGHTRVPA